MFFFIARATLRAHMEEEKSARKALAELKGDLAKAEALKKEMFVQE